MTLPVSKKTVIAFIYDFDGTLLPGNAIDYGLLPDLGYKTEEQQKKFWEDNEKDDFDRVNSYMLTLATLAKKNGEPLTKEAQNKYGKNIEKHFHRGLLGEHDWFTRINTACNKAGCEPEHYVISSGLRQMIEGSAIAPQFEKIYASDYHYDANGEPDWPAWTINYTNKTQYLFRINKRVLSPSDDRGLNAEMKPGDRPVPFENMLFFGDGFTDIPCFSLVREYGGHAVAVLRSNDAEGLKQVETLTHDGRVDGVSLSNHFEKDSAAERIAMKVIEKIASKR